MGSGTCEVDVKEGGKGNNGIEVDTTSNLKQTILKENMSTTKGRYVRVLTTERATGYGSSLYEFQVWGTGGASKRPADYGENLALNKKVECSGTRDEWWMYDKDGNLLPDAYKNVKPENAVDGDASTAFTSYQGDDHWITVKVTAIKNGIESKGVTATVNVEAVKTTALTTTRKSETTTSQVTTTPQATTTPQVTTTPQATTKKPESTDVTTKQPGTTETTKEADETSETTNDETTIIVDYVKPTTTKKVVVKKTVVKKAIKKKTVKKVRLTLKKVKGKVSYQVKISVNRKFKNKKKFTVTKTFKKAKFNMAIKKLKKSKKYYVKARVVQVIGKKKYYSGWTKPKKIRIKK